MIKFKSCALFSTNPTGKTKVWTSYEISCFLLYEPFLPLIGGWVGSYRACSQEKGRRSQPSSTTLQARD